MREISLTQGQVALVDDADYEAVNAFKWHAHKRGKNFYARRNIQHCDGSRTTQCLHQFLLPGTSQIDHKDGDGRNNRRNNLRPATKTQNGQGSRQKAPGASSEFRGVCWESGAKRWKAEIKVEGKNIKLGRFVSEIDAAYAYDAAAISFFGEFASPNFSL